MRACLGWGHAHQVDQWFLALWCQPPPWFPAETRGTESSGRREADDRLRYTGDRWLELWSQWREKGPELRGAFLFLIQPFTHFCKERPNWDNLVHTKELCWGAQVF